jgi:hypothetical protein
MGPYYPDFLAFAGAPYFVCDRVSFVFMGQSESMDPMNYYLLDFVQGGGCDWVGLGR